MIVRFGDFVFDGPAHLLTRSGASVHVSPKAFRLLELLISRRPSVVSKQQILDEVWPGQVLEEENVKNLIAELRRAIGDDAIRTVHRVGYAFSADTESSLRPECTWSFSTGKMTYPIAATTRIGRSGECEIQLHDAEVSRVHARVVPGPPPVIEDLGSRNGTFVQGRRIDCATALCEGDVVQIGRVSLVVQKQNANTATRPHVDAAAN